jgi:hypothetical protein
VKALKHAEELLDVLHVESRAVVAHGELALMGVPPPADLDFASFSTPAAEVARRGLTARTKAPGGSFGRRASGSPRNLRPRRD